jgi:hypothetical protein
VRRVSLAHDDETPAVATALPSHAAEKRDLLGNFCFYLHFAVMIYIVSGWLAPFHAALVCYLAFLPLVSVQWQFNKNSCVLNNIESLIRSGQWRDPNNKEEGAWLQTLALSVTGILFKPWQMDAFTYFIIAVLWAAGLSHLLWW